LIPKEFVVGEKEGLGSEQPYKKKSESLNLYKEA